MDFLAFRWQFEQQHPSSIPIKERVISAYPGWLKKATLVMFVCAALVSGAHTVPTIHDGIEASVVWWVADVISLLALAAIEAAIFISAYARVGGKSKTPIVILLVAFFVAVVANIHSTSKALNVSGADVGTAIVAFVSGIGMPLIALMAGELYVRMHSADRRAAIEADERYRAEQRVFDEAVLTAWGEYERAEEARLEREAERQHQLELERQEQQRREDERARRAERRTSTTGQRLSAAARVDVDMDSAADNTADGHVDSADGRGHSTGQGYMKNMGAADQMRAYLRDNPTMLVKSGRWLADNVGIGKKSLWSEIKKEFEGWSSADTASASADDPTDVQIEPYQPQVFGSNGHGEGGHD